MARSTTFLDFVLEIATPANASPKGEFAARAVWAYTTHVRSLPVDDAFVDPSALDEKARVLFVDQCMAALGEEGGREQSGGRVYDQTRRVLRCLVKHPGSWDKARGIDGSLLPPSAPHVVDKEKLPRCVHQYATRLYMRFLALLPTVPPPRESVCVVFCFVWQQSQGVVECSSAQTNDRQGGGAWQ